MLDKKKYKRAEVESLLESVKTDYNEKLADYKEKINILSRENGVLNEKLARLDAEYSIISSSIKSAQEKADEIRRAINDEY